MKPPTVAILGYHKLGDPPPEWWSWYYVPEDIFVSQLAWLRDHDWKPIDLERLEKGLLHPETLPERSVLITFDDGSRSVLEVGVPCLQRFQCPAVMFMPTNFAGRTNEFDHDVEPDDAICDWDELKELQRAGIAIQSHSVAHPRLSEMAGASQAEELIKSKEAIETAIGSLVTSFAYPYGDSGTVPSTMSAMLRSAGYNSAFLYGGGALRLPAADPYHLPRLAMGPDTNLAVELASL